MKKILFLSIFIIFISAFFSVNRVLAATEVVLDDYVYGSECYGGTDDFYVDIPSSYSGSKISLRASYDCADLGISLCSGWAASCQVNVSPGQRLNFQVSYYCGYCGDYENDNWTVYADSVTGPVCGNGSCESGETCSNCSSDCGNCGPVCGNGSCESGESCSSCSSDCGACKKSNGSFCSFASECSSNYCVHGTCRSSQTYCGDNHCDSWSVESCSNCPSDCDVCPKSDGSSCYSNSECSSNYCVHMVCRASSVYCGDAHCDSGESCSSCSSDCGSCEPVKKSNGSYCSSGSECEGGYCVYGKCRSSSTYCGDNYCDGDETCSNCSSDCGSCVTTSKCGGLKCDLESCSNNSECQGYCVHGTCRSSSIYCGDSQCDSGETCSSCSSDCGTCPASSGGCTENYQCEKSEYTCARCRSGYRRCDTYQNKCVECKSSSECISGYTCKNYNCERITESAPAPIAPKPEEKKETAPAPSTTKEKKAVCGNKNPEYWLGETCQTCPQDFGLLTSSCCAPGKFFMYPSDYQNKIDKFHEALGGIIPDGTFIVPKQMTAIKSFFADYKPEVCRAGKVAEGECTNNWDCPGGVCNKNFQCVKTTSEEFKKVDDQDLANRIHEKQTKYETTYSQTYNKIKDDINSCVQGNGLKICLEIQGSTVKNKKHEVNKGEPVIALLRAENITDYNIAVIPEISFSGVTSANINNKIEIKEYNIGLDWSGGIYSVLGSFLTSLEKIMGGKYLVMPSGSKLIVNVKFIPKQTGTINIQGTVFSTSDAEFANADPGLIDIILKPQQYEKNFKKAKVDVPIVIKEKPCKWLFCL